jgi:hypothetical protein
MTFTWNPGARRCLFCSRRLDRRRRSDRCRGAHRQCVDSAELLAKIAGPQVIDTAWNMEPGDIVENLRQIKEQMMKEVSMPKLLSPVSFILPPGVL